MAADGFAVGEGREFLVSLELAMEIGRGRIAALVGNLLHGLVGLGEQTSGAGDAQFVEILGDGTTGALLEQAAEGAFAKASQGGEFGDVERFAEVGLDVGDDVTDAVRGIGIDRRMEAGSGDFFEVVGAGSEFEELD